MLGMAATKGLIDHLLLAACEWFLMFWVFIDAALAYSLTKFARYCDLQIPCLLCSRLDHFFDKEESGSYYHLFCNKHQEDISYLIYCNLHNELVDIREICEDCLHSQSNLECYRFVVDKNFGCMSSIRKCSCCKRQWKEKPSGQPMIDPHMIASRVSNVTTKPPLPRVVRRGRPGHGDGVRKTRNKLKKRGRYAMSHGCYSDANLTSDSEFEFLFSDDDDGSLKDHSVFINRGNKNVDNRYKILGRHTYSTPDFGSLLLEATQGNENKRTRSTSITPHVARSLRRTEDYNNNHLKVNKHVNPSTSSMDGTMFSSNFGSLNSNRMFSRHSYSACDLQNALLLEMQLNSLPRRSASVTPNSSSHGFGEFKWPKYQPQTQTQTQTQPQPTSNDTVQNYFKKAKKSKKSHSSTNSMRRSGSYGHLDDSAISHNNNQNHNKIPRRHSYSVFQLGCEILLNMPNDESMTSNGSFGYGFEDHNKRPSFSYGFEDPNKRPVYSQPPDFDPLNAVLFHYEKPKGYGTLDDSFIPGITGNQNNNHNALPRRHSYSFFECEVLLNMPNDESITSRPAPITQKPLEFPNKKARKAKKNSSPSLYKSNGPTSWDDSVISHNTSSETGNRNPRRHSYSAFELGCALLFEMQKDEDLKRRRSNSVTPNPPVVVGLGEQNKTKFQNRPNSCRSQNPFLERNHGSGAFDDSVVPHNKGNSGHMTLPRRHSYSVFQIGGDILFNMPHDEILTGQSSFLAPNDSIGFGESQTSIFHIKQSPYHSPEHKSHHQHPLHHHHHHNHPGHHNGVPLHPPSGSVKRFTSSSDFGNDFSNVFLDKNKWHGSMDDSVVYRSMNRQNQNNVPRRHSYSAFDLGCALLEMQLDESLKRSYAPPAPNFPSGHGLGEFHQSNFQIQPNTISSEGNAMRGKMSQPRSDGYESFDELLLSHKMVNQNQNQNQNQNPRRHSYSAFELGCALLLDMHLDESMKRRRSASITPGTIRFEEPRNSKIHNKPGPLPPAHPVNIFDSSNDSSYNNRHHGSVDDSFVPRGKGNRKRNRNLPRNSYSVSDLTSPSFEMHMEESLISKSASLTPSCSIGQGLGDLNWLKFQTGTSSGPPEVDGSQLPHKKRKKFNKSKKGKKKLQSANYGEGDDYWYDSYDDSGFSNDTVTRNRYTMFSRNSQSANDLGSVLLEMHLDDSIRSRSKSLTPNSSIGYGSHEENWSKSQIKPTPSHSPTEKHKRNNHHSENEKDKKHLPPLIPTKETDLSSHIRNDVSSVCSERMDARSLDGSTYTEIEVDGFIEKVKRKAEDDVRCMRLLQSELEAERNAATVAANHAMNMITRLQQEKASLQMEALQYLRMMEEQAEYDMEALQKANELVEEKENEIQDLLDELEQYRNVHVPVIIFENEKRYILESLSTLEKKLHQLGGDPLNDDNSFLTPKDSSMPNGAFDNKSQEVELANVEHELLEIKEKMEGLQADIDLVKHACNTLHANEGLDFIQEITHQLQDLRRIMVDKRCFSSN